MERRRFLVLFGEGLVASAAALAWAGCGGSSSSPSEGFDLTSSLADGHAHIVTIRLSDLASPPAGGVAYTSGSFAGHTHRLVLSQADLLAVQGGQTLARTTTVEAAHDHLFTIRRP